MTIVRMLLLLVVEDTGLLGLGLSWDDVVGKYLMLLKVS